MSGRSWVSVALVGVLVVALAACSTPAGTPSEPPQTPSASATGDPAKNPGWQAVPIDQQVRDVCWSPAAKLAAVLATSGDDVTVSGVDLAAGTVAWTSAVATVPADPSGYSNSHLGCDKEGHAVVVATPPYDGERAVTTTVATVGMKDGTVVAKRDVPDMGSYFLVAGLVVLQTGDLVDAYATTDLTTPVWETAGRVSGVVGDDFVVLESLVVRADTGAPAGFGDDVGGNGVSYAGSGAGHVIRVETLGDVTTGKGECQVRYQGWDVATNAPLWTVTGMQGVFSYADEVFYLLSGVTGTGIGCACQLSAGRPTMTAYSMKDGSELWSLQLPEFSGTTGIEMINDTDPASGLPQAVTSVAYRTQVAGTYRKVVVLVNIPGREAQTVEGDLTGYGAQTAHFATSKKGANPGQVGYDTLSVNQEPLWTVDYPSMAGDGGGVMAAQVGPWLVAYPAPARGDARGLSVLREK